MADLRFASLRLEKGGRTILNGVDGVLTHGRITAILGPNGAGKSSLLHCLAGLEVPTGGEVTLGGALLSALSAQDRARSLGFLPQRAELHWNMAVRALVELGRLVHSGGTRLTSDDAAIVDAVMADMDIVELSHRPIWTLSGGEQARVLLGRVLAGQPEWLIADEPVASLDPAHQLSVLRKMEAVARAGAGVALVLHDVNHAARIADDIMLIKDGSIVAHGPAAAVLTPEILQQVFDVPFRRIAGETAFLIGDS